MKKIIRSLLMVLAASIILAGCGSINSRVPVNPATTSHKVQVTVKGVDAVECEEESDWKLTAMTKLGKDHATVWLFSGLSTSDYTRFAQDLEWLNEKTEIRAIKVMINSPGGNAFTGLSISDLIRKYRNRGWKIDTYGSGIIASAAVPIFASGENRIADSAAIFMVHEAALWKWPGRETASDIRAQNELMELLREKYMKFLVTGSRQAEDAWLLMEAKTSWFSADKAFEIGLATEVE